MNLDHAKIVSPVDGLVAERLGRLRAIATSAGEPLFRLIADGHIEIEAEVVETAISSLRVGNEVSLDTAGIGPVSGEVRLISPVVDPVTRLGLVRVSTNGQSDLRVGLFSSGWVIITKRTSLSVPASTVLTDATGAYVLRVTNNTIARQPVTAGLLWQDRREVVQGLAQGDIVVARAGAFFADGDVDLPQLEGTGQ